VGRIGPLRGLLSLSYPNGKTKRPESSKMNSIPITNPQVLGEEVRRRRRELGLTQGELADVGRTTLRFVSELENGKRTAQLDGVLRVLAALGIELVARSR
jgi:HTH-type transcriptional regulator / antitoxin HipB